MKKLFFFLTMVIMLVACHNQAQAQRTVELKPDRVAFWQEFNSVSETDTVRTIEFSHGTGYGLNYKTTQDFRLVFDTDSTLDSVNLVVAYKTFEIDSWTTLKDTTFTNVTSGTLSFSNTTAIKAPRMKFTIEGFDGTDYTLTPTIYTYFWNLE